MRQIDYKVIDFSVEPSLSASFLDAGALAHGNEKKSDSWLHWKFGDNGFGKSTVACALSNNEIVGCVAIAPQEFICEGHVVKGGMSYETFVHPGFQGQGIFKNLIALAELECKKRGFDFLLNFPNSNSLNGFLRMGWQRHDFMEYWIKFRNPFAVLISVIDLKKPFIAGSSNFNELDDGCIESQDFGLAKYDDFEFVLDPEYIKWRFFKYPNGLYCFVEDENCFSVARVGYRGRLKELQILFVKRIGDGKVCFNSLLKRFYDKWDFDMISMPISRACSLRSALKRNLFIKVPNSGACCSKVFTDDKQFDFSRLTLFAVSAHTY